MIRVHVTLPPGWSKRGLDERGWLELPKEANLAAALKAIRMPRVVAKMMLVSVNGAICKTDETLRDGDCIAFIPVITGG